VADGKMVGLPISVASPVDLGRVLRELEAIDSTLNQSAIRGEQVQALPKMSEMLNQVVELNKLDLLQETHRKLLAQFLVSIRERAPRLHMSFSVDPSPQFSEKLTAWLREKIHPLVLITFGLQPNIGAGCVMRTTNKYFDFSLGAALTKNRDLVMKSLREAIAQPLATDPAASAMPTEGVAA
jgi:F0F1-type ATP synthase delta subunit